MKKSMLFILPLSFASAVWCQKEVVWADLLDQNGQFWQQACDQSPGACGHYTDINPPDFPLGQTNDQSKTKILNAIQIAYKKGVRVIDVIFDCTVDEASNPPKPALLLYANRGQNWVKAVDDFNKSTSVVAGQYLKLRLRLPADLNAAAELGGYTVKKAVSEYGGIDGNIPDLGDADMRNRIAQSVDREIADVKNLVSPVTLIESVALTFDIGGETSLYPVIVDLPAPGFCNRISFGANRYPLPSQVSNSLQARARFYRLREADLKRMLTQFAATVKARDPSIKPAVFFQGWSLGDGVVRGSFDLYGLLNGTGVKVLHHTIWPLFNNVTGYPNLTRTDHAEAVAYSASVAKALGIEFDTEFSWPWYKGSLPGQESSRWPGPTPPNATTLPTGNAIAFYNQAVAGFGYGASGFIYANWPTTLFSFSTLEFSCSFSCTVATEPHWKNLIGEDSRMGLPFNDSHLHTSSGLLSSPQIDALPEATKAIYVSSLGRFGCEELATVNDPSLGTTPCGAYSDRTYWNWFTQFGLSSNMTRQKVDFITDGMIMDNKVNWSKYSAIFLPFEVSQLTEKSVVAKIDALPSSTKACFKVQPSLGSTSFQDYAYWKAATHVVNTVPILTPILGPLLY
jgi:hypothetical protein